MEVAEQQRALPTPRSVLARIVVGVNGTGPSLEACRQAARLVDPDGWLELFTAVCLPEGSVASWSASRIADELDRAAAEALRPAEEIAGPRAASRFADGRPTRSLIAELQRTQATLVAPRHAPAQPGVGDHVRRARGRDAPSRAVLGADRTPAGRGGAVPRLIVVGVDGSPEADDALSVAQALARRFDAQLRIVTALGGKVVDLERVQLTTELAETIDRRPVQGLVDAAKAADLLVVGSRGVHGIRTFGSVSERVAHRAASSVLVVRHWHA